jgi:AMMECR1 domain-containing protein
MTAPRLTSEDRTALLALARAAILHRLGLGPAPRLPAGGGLGAPRGAFVAVAVAGVQRAALGTLSTQGPLAGAVAALAARAVDGDPRTPPLSPADAPALAVRLAVLSDLRPLPPSGAIRVGLDGVAVTQGWQRGLLLPSAAAGKGWDGAAFLKHACLAAGLPARAHLEPDASVEVFEAEEFGE